MEEKGCEHEGLRLEMERMALEPGLMGIIFVAMVFGGGVSVETGQLEREVGEKWRNED